VAENFEFVTDSSVFSKKRIDIGTQLLIESMVLPKTGSVLDIGCGYGCWHFQQPNLILHLRFA
jgi:16S rRNA (guanine1207-N2)-methyltransferase